MMLERISAITVLLVLAVTAQAQVEVNEVLLREPIGATEELPLEAQAVVDSLSESIASVEADGAEEAEVEIVRERYDNRRVSIEREVVQDQEQNYVNHGKWKKWDPQGNVLVEGRYNLNERDGVWTRVFHTREVKLLSIAPFNQGQLPLVSQANFKDGQLDGKWVVYDANKRKLCEWEFSEGKRHGKSTWWYISGVKMREISYSNGTIHGELNEWDRTSKQVTEDIYVEGRRLAKKVENYGDNTKKAEGSVLYPKLVLDKPDDWFTCTLATYTQEGEPVKHGTWTSWYQNGQRKLEGIYDNDVPTGEFVWWHSNGQKSLVATYRDGKKHGLWTWWHPNGLKSIQGEYVHDTPTSDWLWWKDSGKVAQRADFSDPNQQQQIIAMPSSGEMDEAPSATRPDAQSVLK